MKMIRNVMFILFVIGLSICFGCIAIADDISQKGKLAIYYGSQTNLDISHQGINRISVQPKRVSKIVGDSSDFTAIVVDDGSDIFITSKKPVGTKINCSIILVDNSVLDINLNVIALEYPAIIKLDLDHYKDGHVSENVDSMLLHMQRAECGKYYVQHTNKLIKATNNHFIKIVQTRSYRFGNLYGGIFEIKNLSSKRQNFSTEDFYNSFDGSIASLVSKEELLPGEVTLGYLVFRGGNDD